VRAVPVLKTPDLAASMTFWTAAEFSVNQYGDDFASAHHDRVELHLVLATPARDHDPGEAYLHVRGVDVLHDAWAAAGLPVTDVRDQPWEMREFNVVDPVGEQAIERVEITALGSDSRLHGEWIVGRDEHLGPAAPAVTTGAGIGVRLIHAAR